jgi:hypothetical protein
MASDCSRQPSQDSVQLEFSRGGWAIHATAVLFLVTNLLACTPAEKRRDVTAVIEGPDRIAIGESVMLIARLEYSDGTVFLTQPTANESVDWSSSNPAVATILSVSGPERRTGLLTGVAPGEALITATPTATTTGTGRRIPGTLRITVVE